MGLLVPTEHHLNATPIIVADHVHPFIITVSMTIISKWFLKHDNQVTLPLGCREIYMADDQPQLCDIITSTWFSEECFQRLVESMAHVVHGSCVLTRIFPRSF